MGQGLYRMVGYGVLNPPDFDVDNTDNGDIYAAVECSYEAEPPYMLIPFGVDDEFLQDWMRLPGLPDGLPHVHDRTAVEVADFRYPSRARGIWECLRTLAKTRGIDLPEGGTVFVCDWD